MREGDAHDCRPELRRRCLDRLGGPGDHRVDERQAVVLPDQVTVDEAKARNTSDVWHDRTFLEGITTEHSIRTMLNSLGRACRPLDDYCVRTCSFPSGIPWTSCEALGGCYSP